MSPIVIARAEDPLPVCTPYLMPFHIDYSGPAPISTYFRVKPAPPPGYLGKTESLNSILDTTQSSQCSAGSQVSTTSDATLVASSPSATLGSQGGGSSQETLADDVKQTKAIESGERFIAAFRGRTVQGLTVNLPEGYAGLILQAPDASNDTRASGKRDAAQANGPRGTRGARRSSRQEAMATDAVGADVEELEPGDAVRTLRPAATFSSFVLWNQDTAVDEGRDEYLRSIREWTRLAAEVHRAEDI